MLQQYQKIKSRHRDCILFFRLGDFYEMFYDDAKTASRILDLVLTSRGKGTANQVPMCGIPYHSAENYIARLIKAGQKIAICEQMEDPSAAKGIVRRDVVRIITSGTYLDENSHDTKYLLSLAPKGGGICGMAFTDPASGTIYANEYSDRKRVVEFIARLPVYECVFPISQQDMVKEILDHPLLKTKSIVRSPHEDWCYNPGIAEKTLCEHFGIHNLKAFGIDGKPAAVAGAGALLEYLRQMNKQPLKHIDKVSLYADDDYVFISPAATHGLEMETLFNTIDYTCCALGKRKLRYWLYHPLRKPADILQRQAAVRLLKEEESAHKNLKHLLSRTPDIEKSVSRLSCGYLSPKDLLAIRNGLELLPDFQKTLQPLAAKNRYFEIKDISGLRETMIRAINPDMPLSNAEGKVICRGYHPDLDELRSIQENGRQWLAEFQKREIKRTGINSMKVGYNRVFGYYIEITKAHLKNAPADYIRKQTLVNAERFITQELKEYEDKILTAEDKIIKIENEILLRLQNEVLAASVELHEYSQALGTVDTIFSLSVIARLPGYTAPEINSGSVIDIKDGRHPVVERTINDNFVPNDVRLDSDGDHLIILTGPNMAGKSTYIRQAAILVILAQTGSYIPAKSAVIGVVDKVFTRIGAHDDIAKGQSTFMVEMSETADILNNLTDRSLVVLDEIGRGTSTYDGLSLAWALAEHFQRIKTRTLFATHFHELTALAGEHSGVKNYNVAVKEWKDEIIFLHKIVEGSTDDSYGIYVAKLAGVPADIIKRSRQILTRLELKNNLKENLGGKGPESQLDLNFQGRDKSAEALKAALEKIDVDHLTPMEALNKISQLKDLMKET